MNTFLSFVFLSVYSHLISAIIVANNDKNETEKFHDFEAEFGTTIGQNGLMGILVASEPPDGCMAIKQRPYFPNDFNITINVFVLIRRGTCDFAVKVLNAQEANYNAAIVYNVGSDDLLHMGSYYPHLEDQINIPSVFVGETSGLRLNKSYTYSASDMPYVKIIQGEAPFSFKLYIIPFLAVIGSSFLILLCFMVVRAFRQRRRRRRSRLSRERLKQIPVKEFQKGDEYESCAICLDDYENGDQLRILPCKHAYHSKCVDLWLTTNKRVCPLCKRKVLSDDEDTTDSELDYEDDSDTNEGVPLLRGGSFPRPRSPPRTGYGSGMTSPYNNAIRSFIPTAANPVDLVEPSLSPRSAPNLYEHLSDDNSGVGEDLWAIEVDGGTLDSYGKSAVSGPEVASPRSTEASNSLYISCVSETNSQVNRLSSFSDFEGSSHSIEIPSSNTLK